MVIIITIIIIIIIIIMVIMVGGSKSAATASGSLVSGINCPSRDECIMRIKLHKYNQQ